MVASGILLSRLLGLVREHFRARYFGSGVAADAWAVAFRLPNLLQNLFGEAALSASFIPVYSSLLQSGDEKEASRVAGAVGAILAVAVSVFVLAGVLLTPVIVPIVAAGFNEEQRALTITVARILFPGAGLFVLGAWCLGILNSHRRFFLSYAAPVAWNLVMIGTLVWQGPRNAPERLVIWLAVGSVIGALLQFGVQLPTVLKLAKGVRLHWDTTSERVRTVLRNFFPAFASRGTVQLSAYVDQFIASFLPVGMMGLMSYAANVYVLPVSLFGISISAAELPEMSRLGQGADAREAIRQRLSIGLRRIAFFVVPSAIAFVVLGDVIIALLFQTGEFGAEDTLFTWGILAGSAVGLIASTMARLCSSTFHALGDTRTPLRFAIIRVTLTAVLGVIFAFPLPGLLGIDPRWGAAGLTASAGLAGWIEYNLLRRALRPRVGIVRIPVSFSLRLWIAGLGAATVALWLSTLAWPLSSKWAGLGSLAAFAALYGAATLALRIPEARSLSSRILGRLRR
jgi:putative peptidoglycan lipid II flippase